MQQFLHKSFKYIFKKKKKTYIFTKTNCIIFLTLYNVENCIGRSEKKTFASSESRTWDACIADQCSTADPC